MAGQGWKVSFKAGDSFRERQRDAQPAGGTSEQHPCARGTWCYGRTVSTVDGQPVITAALTYRAYCDRCSAHIGNAWTPCRKPTCGCTVRSARRHGAARWPCALRPPPPAA